MPPSAGLPYLQVSDLTQHILTAVLAAVAW